MVGMSMSSRKVKWLWEFTKKVVTLCVLLYSIGFMFSCYMMYHFQDLSSLDTFITESSDIIRTCVFGYFIKALGENIFKIKNSKKQVEEESEEQAYG